MGITNALDMPTWSRYLVILCLSGLFVAVGLLRDRAARLEGVPGYLSRSQTTMLLVVAFGLIVIAFFMPEPASGVVTSAGVVSYFGGWYYLRRRSLKGADGS